MSEKQAADKKTAVEQVLTLLFPSSKVIFSPRSLVVNGSGTTVIIDERNFEFL
jgi:hypothetical protein